MSVTRRDFLKVGGLFLSSTGLEIAYPKMFHRIRSQTGFSILQTYTNESTAQFRILTETGLKTVYQAADPQGRPLNVEMLDRYIHPAWPGQAMDHLKVSNLKLGVDYSLRVIDESTGQLLDERIFSSLDRSKPEGRFAFISCCCDDFPAIQEEMWRVVAEQNPDVVFLIGDAHYLDGRQSDDEKGIWRRHLEVRKALDLYRWKRLRPVISIWDDHDFGINDGGEDFPLKEATRQMFEAMFGSSSELGLVRGPSLALEAELFGQRFYLMDDRFYRTHNNPKGTHWGDEQEEWLLSRLAISKAPAFLMNGSQFYGGYADYESFQGEHPEQFQRVQKKLAQSEAPVVFVSGDRHFSELMKIEKEILGYETFEITSSSLHSYRPSQVPSEINPRRVMATAEFNFVLAESSADPQGLNLKMSSIGTGARILFSHSQKIQR